MKRFDAVTPITLTITEGRLQARTTRESMTDFDFVRNKDSSSIRKTGPFCASFQIGHREGRMECAMCSGCICEREKKRKRFRWIDEFKVATRR